jgi:hypothetical protein
VFHLEGDDASTAQTAGTVEGFGHVASLYSIEIQDCGPQNLDGLAVTQLTYLSLAGNAKLTSSAALSQVTTLDEVVIDSNPALSSVDGLEHVASLSYLTITGNGTLGSLRGLSGPAAVTERTTIEHNPHLAQCEIGWLAQCAHFDPTNLASNGPIGVCEP